MNKVKVYLTQRDLFLDVIIVVFLVNDAPERLLYLLASLHDLPLDHPVVDTAVLLNLCEHRVLLVYPLQVPILYLTEHSLPRAVNGLALLQLSLLDVHDLPDMEHIFDSCLDVPHQFLGDLDLLVNGLGGEEIGRQDGVSVKVIRVCWLLRILCLNYQLLLSLLISTECINRNLLLY